MPGGRQALDQGVQQRLGLGVDPVEILEHQQQRLPLALAEQQLLDRVEGGAAALGRVALRPGGLGRAGLGIDRHVEQRQQRRQRRRQGRVERHEAGRHLLAHGGVVVAALDLEVASAAGR